VSFITGWILLYHKSNGSPYYIIIWMIHRTLRLLN